MTDHTKVLIRSWLNEDGNSMAHAVLTPTSDTREKIIECKVGPIVPIILSQTYKFDGNKIKTSPKKSLLEFNHVVAKREKYLREKKREGNAASGYAETGRPWLEDARSPKKDTRLLTFREFEDRKTAIPYDMEGYVYLGDTMFSLTFLADPRKLPLAIASNTALIENIMLRDNNDIPTEAGYLFDGGFIKSKGEAREWAKVFFTRPDTPGSAIFGVAMRPRLISDDNLLDRVPKLMRMLANLATHTRTLRSGDRTVAGMPGQELLVRVNANGVTGYQFIWEFIGRDDDVDGPIALTHPHTRIELRVGGDQTGPNATTETSVLTQEETLALWDALLAGFKLRPGSV